MIAKAFLAPIMRWNACFVRSRCSIVGSVAAKTGTAISYDMGAVSPIKNGGCTNLMVRHNCKLGYGRGGPHRGGGLRFTDGASASRRCTAIVFSHGHALTPLFYRRGG